MKSSPRGTALLLGLAVCGGVAAADEDPHRDGGVNVQLGTYARASRAALNWETPVLWSWQRHGGPSRLELTGELGVAYWSAKHSRQSASAWQLNAVPMFRYWPGGASRCFVEAGIGATLLNRAHFAGDSFSTAFQFGDHLGAGYQLTPSQRVSLRFSHFSNAAIKQPNPGLNSVQMVYTYLP